MNEPHFLVAALQNSVSILVFVRVPVGNCLKIVSSHSLVDAALHLDTLATKNASSQNKDARGIAVKNMF